jgi:hypothetical protein
MIDEFLWNRNRNLRKVWADIDFGSFQHSAQDDKTIHGNRFSFTAGVDWQQWSDTLLGFAARVSHLSSDGKDSVDLSYGINSATGTVSYGADDTVVGFGAYILSTLDTNKVRGYGNLFLDLHMLSVERDQTFMASISGQGTDLALVSEWGLLHDISSQYLVGNVYARVGYNFGFDITESAGGGDYMNLKSDGYFILTPGYSLSLQKRFYMTPWFQIRPNISAGVEYDVGGSSAAAYKFAPASEYSKYKLNIDPLWLNGQIGADFIMVSGFQFGVNYRYHYNPDIQSHDWRITASYRF